MGIGGEEKKFGKNLFVLNGATRSLRSLITLLRKVTPNPRFARRGGSWCQEQRGKRQKEKHRDCGASLFVLVVQKRNYLKILILPHSVNGMQPVALKNIYRRFNIIRRCLGVGKRIEHTESFIS